MNLLIFSILITFILLNHDIILINEESLILICFGITISLIISKFSYLSGSIFWKYKTHQKENLLNVLTMLNHALTKIVSQKQNKKFLRNLIKIKNYWTEFGKNLIYWIGFDMLYKTRFSFMLCFRSLQYNEGKITKLLNLALNQDLNKKILVNCFIETKLLNFKLKAQNLIVMREWLQFDKISTLSS